MMKLFFFILGCAVLVSGPLSYKPNYKAIIEAKRAHNITMSYNSFLVVKNAEAKR